MRWKFQVVDRKTSPNAVARSLVKTSALTVSELVSVLLVTNARFAHGASAAPVA
jgi:hypothetical protein